MSKIKIRPLHEAVALIQEAAKDRAYEDHERWIASMLPFVKRNIALYRERAEDTLLAMARADYLLALGRKNS